MKTKSNTFSPIVSKWSSQAIKIEFLEELKARFQTSNCLPSDLDSEFLVKGMEDIYKVLEITCKQTLLKEIDKQIKILNNQ